MAGNHEEKLWTFKEFLGHQDPLQKYQKDYIRSLYSILPLWDNDSETDELIDIVIEYGALTNPTGRS
jgi:hypothetical protein